MASTIPGEVQGSAAAAAAEVTMLPGQTRRKVQMSVVACFVLLLVLVLCCYLRTLKGYFLADDFGEVTYVGHIWDGQWKDYWLDWISNTQRLPGMAVYRPWFITTLVLDYGLWRANAFGFYLTNVVYYTLDVLLLFAVVRKLTEKVNVWGSVLCAFFSAALFAVSPLHPESISWSGGRTDTICCTYFLAALLIFLEGRTRSNKLFTAAALLCFWLGILTKEMAIAFPVVATSISVMFPSRNASAGLSPLDTLRSRTLAVMKETAPYWASTVIYFMVRYLTLGTVGGGYTGGFDGQSTALARVLDPDNYHRLLFPLSIGLFEQKGILFQELMAGYLCAAALIGCRLWRREISVQNLGVLFAWIAATAAPIYQVWGLGMNLEGARYYFFLTLPMSLFLPLLLLAPSNPSAVRTNKSGKMITGLSVVILSLLLLVNFKIASKTNGSWIEAGKEVRACTSAAVELAKQMPAGKQIPVLGIPKKYIGAHMMYNGPTFLMAVSRPFYSQSYGSCFQTFDPPFFGPDQFINATRFKAVLHKEKSNPYIWNGLDRQWKPVTLEHAKGSPDPLNLSAGQNLSGPASIGDQAALKFSGLNVNPLDYDFLQFDYRAEPDSQGKFAFDVRWNGSGIGDGLPDLCSLEFTERLDPLGRQQWHTVRIPVSHYWHWYDVSKITDLTLLLPPGRKLAIRNVALLSDQHVRPSISAMGTPADAIGVWWQQLDSKIYVDVSNIPGANQVSIECTRPNYYFDAIDPKYLSSAIYKRRTLPGCTGTIVLDKSLCPLNSYCEIRARALDSMGHPVGEYSDPLTLFVRP